MIILHYLVFLFLQYKQVLLMVNYGWKNPQFLWFIFKIIIIVYYSIRTETFSRFYGILFAFIYVNNDQLNFKSFQQILNKQITNFKAIYVSFKIFQIISIKVLKFKLILFNPNLLSPNFITCIHWMLGATNTKV